MPTNINDPDEIIRAVGRHEEQTRPLRDRMEGDFRLYRLEPFQEVDGYGHPVEGFRSYTSNAPQVYADKVIQWIARAEFGIRIPQAGRTGAQRAVDALKEKWTWGLMRSVDRRIQQRMEPPMRDLTAFHNVVRGMVAGRWLMMNTASGETVVDMTPWDPMHTYWSVGTEGLEWACYKVRKTRGEIRAEYGVDIGEDIDTLRVGAQDGDDAEMEVYDFYDRTHNTVVAGNGVVLKRPTPHGAGRVPVVIVPVGPVPLVQTDAAMDSVSDYGESVFKSNREIYDKHNLMMSIFLELAARARRPPLGVKSRDGRKTLDEDPYMEGTTISMSEGDEVQAFPLLKTTQDAADLTGRISGEVQRGSIPHSVYGELQFQLSGFAINTLRSGLGLGAAATSDRGGVVLLAGAGAADGAVRFGEVLCADGHGGRVLRRGDDSGRHFAWRDAGDQAGGQAAGGRHGEVRAGEDGARGRGAAAARPVDIRQHPQDTGRGQHRAGGVGAGGASWDAGVADAELDDRVRRPGR